jgi:hypothetical protein
VKQLSVPVLRDVSHIGHLPIVFWWSLPKKQALCVLCMNHNAGNSNKGQYHHPTIRGFRYSSSACFNAARGLIACGASISQESGSEYSVN